MEVQEKWRHEQQLPLKLITDTTTHKKHASSRVRYRQAIGSAFLQWKSGSGKDSKQQLADYLLTIRRYSGMPPKKERVWLARCENLAKHAEACEASIGRAGMPVKTGRRRRTNAAEKVPDRFLLRRRMNQGPPYKCPVIREVLWDWFVDIRRSLAQSLARSAS